MSRPDFSRQERNGYSILYAETEAAEDWMLEHDEPGNLSGGLVADEEMLEAIRESGLTVEGCDDESE